MKPFHQRAGSPKDRRANCRRTCSASRTCRKARPANPPPYPVPEDRSPLIRIGIPPLTEERRRQLAKQCKAEGETAKVSVRNARRDGIDALKKAVKDGLAEDEQKNAEAKLQKIHDKYIKQIEDMLADKDKEIMTV